MYTFLRKITNW